jgi:4-hydroxy-tetrahydrodipicolinate synthase
VNAVRAAVERAPVIPGLKAILAHHAGDPGWETPRPPLVPLDAERRQAVLAELARLGFAMVGLRG